MCFFFKRDNTRNAISTTFLMPVQLPTDISKYVSVCSLFKVITIFTVLVQS